MPSKAEAQYGRIICEEAGHPRIKIQAGETTNIIERFEGKIQHYNQVLNIYLTVESNPQVQDIAISNLVIQVNPETTGAIRNEDFLLLHECAHEKQRALLGFQTTEALIDSFTQDLTTTEIGARDWVEKYTMPPFVVSPENQSVIFNYYSGEQRISVARGIRDVHSDVIALRNRKNIYMTDQERKEGMDSEEKFYSQFEDELTANIPKYDYRLVQDTEPDFIRKIARFKAVAAGSAQFFKSDGLIVEKYDAYMKTTFGENSQQYQVYTALSQAYQTYFLNCTQRTELIDPEQIMIILDSTNPLLQVRAIDFLGELGDIRAMKHLTERFLVEENLDIKTSFGDAIIEIMESNRDNEICNQGVDILLAFLLSRLSKFDYEDRFTQADIMAYLGILQPKHTLTILDKLLSDITPYVEKGIHPFVDVAVSDKNGPIKNQGFCSEDPHITACIIHMMGLIGQAYPDEALRILIPWIKDTYNIEFEYLLGSIHPQIAAEVARIGAVHKKKAIDALEPLMRSDDSFKRRWATFALNIIQGKNGGFIAELPYELFMQSSIYNSSLQVFREFLRENIKGKFEES